MSITGAELQHALAVIAVPGIEIGCRRIADGDELALLPDEMPAFATSVAKVRRASGAARIVARELLARFGQPPAPIPKSEGGMPVWPDGIVGSIAHDDRLAVVAMAARRDFLSVGVDVEPAEPIGPDLLNIIATPSERPQAEADPYRGRVLFAIKEAVYKAVYPLDRRFLDHHDVEVDLAAGLARVRDGRAVRFRCCADGAIVALAFVPSLPAGALTARP